MPYVLAMHSAGKGLSEVRTSDLIKTLRAVVRKDLPVPIDVLGLARNGLQHVSEPLMASLRELDDNGVRAVLICVIAERRDR